MPAIALLVKESLSWLIKVVTTPRNIEHTIWTTSALKPIYAAHGDAANGVKSPGASLRTKKYLKNIFTDSRLVLRMTIRRRHQNTSSRLPGPYYLVSIPYERGHEV